MAGKRAFRTLLAAGCIALGLVQACSSETEPAPVSRAPESTAPDRVVQVVGASGGTVAMPDGNAAVDIPEGALPGDTTITIQSNAAAPTPSSTDVVGTAFTFGPDGLRFLKPVTVTLGFDPARVPAGKVVSQIVVFTAPDGSTAYEPLPTQVKDATHVTATMTHFSTDVAGIPASNLMPTDAGTDAGTCYVNCLSKGAASSQDGSVAISCECQATCDGHTHKMSCTGSSCTCVRDGVETGTPAGQCGTAQHNLSIYNEGCKFPGELAPLPDCGVPACAGTSSPGDAGATSCQCSTTCKGHQYKISCTSDTCSCTTDGSSTKDGTSTGACSNALSTYSTFCGYPVGDGGTSSGDGGAPSTSDGGGHSSTTDGGADGSAP